jgi:ASC-1-like (ASCH) protein
MLVLKQVSEIVEGDIIVITNGQTYLRVPVNKIEIEKTFETHLWAKAMGRIDPDHPPSEVKWYSFHGINSRHQGHELLMVEISIHVSHVTLGQGRMVGDI